MYWHIYCTFIINKLGEISINKIVLVENKSQIYFIIFLWLA